MTTPRPPSERFGIQAIAWGLIICVLLGLSMIVDQFYDAVVGGRFTYGSVASRVSLFLAYIGGTGFCVWAAVTIYRYKKDYLK